MQQYLDLLRDVLENGERRDDRTGTGTIGVFGRQMRFDLGKKRAVLRGDPFVADSYEYEFPLLTTKKVFWKGAVEELLWFLRGSCDVRELQEKKVHFWDSWAGADGTIGHGYGKQLRRIYSYVPVIPKIYDPAESAPLPMAAPVMMAPELGSDDGKTAIRVGSVIDTTAAGKAVIVRQYRRDDGRAAWMVQFVDTGYLTSASYGDIQSGMIADNMRRSVFGVGFYGIDDPKDKHYGKLVNTWREMLRRCYYADGKQFSSYGANGIHVCREWHEFAVFQRDAKKLPGWDLAVLEENYAGYSLDKDVLWASNRYGPDTCSWSSDEEQRLNRCNTAPFTAVSPEGETETFPSIGHADRNFGLSSSAVHRCLHGKLKTHQGWSNFQHIPVPDGHVMRIRVIDQLARVIASLKNDPYSRRHVMTTWNAQDIDRTTLAPCHGTVIQFHVSSGRLSCQMYQRSVDCFLGLPVNIASYALLTRMVAQVCGLQPGELIWTGGDVHIYLNHVEQVKEQLSRTPGAPPTLLLNPEITGIDDFADHDIILENYHPQAAIKGEVSV